MACLPASIERASTTSATSDIESVPLNSEASQAPPQHLGAVPRLAAVAACLFVASALVAQGAIKQLTVPSKDVLHGVSLADAAESKGYVHEILDDIYKKRNTTATAIKEAVEGDNWSATATFAHQYDLLSEHAIIVEEWEEKVMKVYDALDEGAYEQSHILLDEAILIQCMAMNKKRVIDLEFKLSEDVESGDAKGIDKADLVLTLLEQIQDACVKSQDGEGMKPASESSEQVTGTIKFGSGGTATDVEQAVGVILAKNVGVKPSQVNVVAAGTRRLGVIDADDSSSQEKQWNVTFAIGASDSGSAEEPSAILLEIKAKVTAIADDPTVLMDQLAWVLPNVEADSAKIALPPPGPVTGNMVFASGGDSADVEDAVSATLVKFLEAEPSNVIVEVEGARRLRATDDSGGDQSGDEELMSTTDEPAATTEEPDEPRSMPLPWVVSFNVTVADRDAFKKMTTIVGGIAKDPSAFIHNLRQALPDLDPESFQLALPEEGDQTRALFTTTSPAADSCSSVTENCRGTKCCSEPSTYCYEKNEHWAGCRQSCNVGIHEQDPEEHRTKWSCTLLDSSPDAPRPVEDPQPSRPGCSGMGDNCMESQCCADPGYFCHQKNEHHTMWSCDKIDQVESAQPSATCENCSSVTNGTKGTNSDFVEFPVAIPDPNGSNVTIADAVHAWKTNISNASNASMASSARASNTSSASNISHASNAMVLVNVEKTSTSNASNSTLAMASEGTNSSKDLNASNTSNASSK